MSNAGRPTKYDGDTMPEQVYKLCLLGATNEQIADFFEVNVDTIYEWQNRYEQFSEAMKNGKKVADANVAEALYNKATGFYRDDAVKIFMPAGATEPVYAAYREYYPPDTGAAFIWLKNRANWKDKQEVTADMSVRQKPDLESLSTEELEKLASLMEKARKNDTG